MALKDLMQQLHIEKYPDELSQVYQEAMQEYTVRGDAMVAATDLIQLNDTYQLFTDKAGWEAILRAANDIKKRPELLQFICLLKQVCRHKTLADEIMSRIPMPTHHEASLAYDFAPLFALLPFVPEMVANMKKRQLPQDIIRGTLSEFASKTEDFQMLYRRPGISAYTSWLRKFIELEIIRIDRFNIEMKKSFPGDVAVYDNQKGQHTILMNHADMHRSGMRLGAAGCEDEAGSYRADITETGQDVTGYPVGVNGSAGREKVRLPKSEWQCVLTKGDKVLSVHIPAKMSLAHDICEASYARARHLIAVHFPDFAYKAFYCESWMIDPQLATLLGHQANITRFQKKYMPYPTMARGKAVMDFVFLMPRDTQAENLPEDTSLRRAIKKHYLEGKYIYEQGGVFF